MRHILIVVPAAGTPTGSARLLPHRGRASLNRTVELARIAVQPTLSTMSQTAVGQHLARRPLRQAAFVAGNVAATGAAGAVFAWLRLRSGSVLALLLAHAALNDSALIAARLARRLGRDRR